MSREPKSRTRKESFIEETLFGLNGHYLTTISDGDHKVEGRGNSPEKSEEVASNKWDKKKIKR